MGTSMLRTNVFPALVFSRICAIIGEQSCVAEGAIRMDSHLVRDLGLDSLTMYSVLLEWEKLYSVVPSVGAMAEVETVSDFVSALLHGVHGGYEA
jgi:acyl carrier protein